MNRPTAQDFHAIAGSIATRNVYGLGARLAKQAVRNIAGGSMVADGMPTDHGYSDMPFGGEAENTSVESAVLARLTPARDVVDHALGEAIAAMRRAEDALEAAEGWADRLEAMADPRSRDRDVLCVELHCGAPPAKPSKRGRCEPCYHWVQRWEKDRPGEQAPPVPAEIISKRSKRSAGSDELADAG